jgi:hypothetical protein
MAGTGKTAEQKAAERAERAEARRLREEKERREARATRKWLEPLRPRVIAVLTAITAKIRDLDKAERERQRHLDHANGFYEEMDKLAKGKAMLEVTDLMVQSANEIIGDAKALVTGDSYLDRVKQFVPAGNNPVYPDVVVHLRTVRGALVRYKETLEARREALLARYWEAKTVYAGVAAFLKQDAWPTRDVAWGHIEEGSKLHSGWFFAHDGEHYFDLERLRNLELEAYFEVEQARE